MIHAEALTLLSQPSPVLMDMLRCVRDELAAMRELLQRPDADGWIDSKAARAYLGFSKNTFDMHCYQSEPRLPSKKVGGKLLFKRAELDRWVSLWEVRNAGTA